jgi:hypothetical protein
MRLCLNTPGDLVICTYRVEFASAEGLRTLSVTSRPAVHPVSQQHRQMAKSGECQL